MLSQIAAGRESGYGSPLAPLGTPELPGGASSENGDTVSGFARPPVGDDVVWWNAIGKGANVFVR